jgi:hypothetical protein
MRFILSFRERSRGGAVVPGQLRVFTADGDAPAPPTVIGGFPSLTAGRPVVFVIHGYNVDGPSGREALGRYIGFLEPLIPGAVFLAVLWPGDGWAKALSYPFEGRDADDTARYLALWIKDCVAASARLMLVSHSLGARVAMQTATLLVAAARPVDRACLMAASIDDDGLGRRGRSGYRAGTGNTGRIGLLDSAQDEVLRFAYPLGDLGQVVLFPGERPSRALGYLGPRETDAAVLALLDPRQADPAQDIDHGDYLGPNQAGDGTISRSEAYVGPFLGGAVAPRWPAEM